jgi:toluene monooxygenase system ferredoxin subunit
MRGVVVAGKPILLAHVGGRVCAYEDRCPHQAVRLSEGQLDRNLLRCAAHGWTFDLSSGFGVNPEQARLRRYEVRVDGDDVFVDLGEIREEPHHVGPVLARGDETRAVTAAIVEMNPGAIVIDRGAYWRVLVPHRCHVTRAAIARRAGRDFRLPTDLERIMTSFRGRLTIDEDAARWEAGP